MKKTFTELEFNESNVRESFYTLDEVIQRLSSLNSKEHGNYDAAYECLLCLANEIKKINNKLDNK